MARALRIEALSLERLIGEARLFAEAVAWHRDCDGRAADAATGFGALLPDLQLFEPGAGLWLHCGQRSTTARFFGHTFALDLVGHRRLPAEPGAGALSGIYAEVDATRRAVAQRITAPFTPPGGDVSHLVTYDRLVLPIALSFGRAVAVVTRFAPLPAGSPASGPALGDSPPA